MADPLGTASGSEPEPLGINQQSLSHYRGDGSAHMVDISHKAVSTRIASASANFTTRPDVIDLILSGELPKGEALATARIAGIQAAKRTAELIPLCHPLPLSAVTIDFVAASTSLRIDATVKTTSATGVEMEALTAVAVAALTIYDMVKAVDRSAVISEVQVTQKSGGTNDWARTEPDAGDM